MLQKFFLMYFDESPNLIDLIRPEPATVLQTNRTQPKLGDSIFAFDMDMRWLKLIARIKEEAVGTDFQDIW